MCRNDLSEIDSNVHENLVGMIRGSSSKDYKSITDLAKQYYNKALSTVKDYDMDTPERRKQCWQTAVSLARAARYATKEHGTVSPEWSGHNEDEQQSMSKLISHLGDYPV